jgi:hypothetical protein
MHPTYTTVLAPLQVAERAQFRVMQQILANGTLPAEMARTKSWSYSNFALDAFFHLASLLNSRNRSSSSSGGNGVSGGGRGGNSAVGGQVDGGNGHSVPPPATAAAAAANISLWNFESKDGASIRHALDWQLQYVVPSPDGKLPQVTKSNYISFL